jgi:1,4-dihydroxy-6-naphthoate synthase
MANPQAASKTMEIKVAHSPDSDDAFMFYALATNRVKTDGIKFTHVLCDIETLNNAADKETYDVTAISFAAYPYLRAKYILMDCGASFGEGYGPIVVAKRLMKREDLAGCRLGVPGLRTSAYLTMRLYQPDFEAVVLPFDQIIAAVQAGTVDAGLLIHEGQLLFPELGLHKAVDLGQWWQETTKLPLPLGGNAIRRALGPEMSRRIARAISDSINYGLEHRSEALDYAMQFARDMDTDVADKFVGMYVNKWTQGYGERGRAAVQELLNRGVQAGLIPGPATAEFLSGD